jgi:predicted RND superfamily exporter protein
MRYTFNTVGVALCTTTAVLVSGFAILAFSHFSPSVVTGSLLAMTLGFALIVDLLFMPALLMVLGGAVVKT